jgi:polyketide synthase 12
VDAILAELGRIERSLAAAAMDGQARGRIARRLNGLLSVVNGGDAAAAGTGLDAVEFASDEEIFELIDREL